MNRNAVSPEAARGIARIPVIALMQNRYSWQAEIQPIASAPRGEVDADRSLVEIYQADPRSDVGRQAASRLLARYRERVLIWCWRVVDDRELALDLAQEVLLSAYKRLAKYEHDGRFGAWLFTIARHRCLSELRRRRVPLAEDGVLELIADSGPGPDEIYERKAKAGELFELVRESLTPLEQDAIWLRCHEGLPVDVITRRLDISEGTGARAVLQRARRKLRSALESREAREARS